VAVTQYTRIGTHFHRSILERRAAIVVHILVIIIAKAGKRGIVDFENGILGIVDFVNIVVVTQNRRVPCS